MKKEDFLRSRKMVVVQKTTLQLKKELNRQYLQQRKRLRQRSWTMSREDVTDFHIAKQKTKTLLVKNAYKMILESQLYSDEEKKKALKHYERLLNVEFPWSKEDLSVPDPVLGPPILVTQSQEIVEKSLNNMEKGQALVLQVL